MSLVTSEKLLVDAQSNHYAVGAFNIENMEMAQAIIEAAEELSAPVILQTTPSTVRYAGLDMYFAIVKSLADKSKIPVAVHLDHGESFDMAVQAIRAGYTSIMIDGSHESFKDNILLTKRVVDVAKPNLIPVEAELGKVGGKEDDIAVTDGVYTDPEDAVEFVKRTGISSLAVAIGTAHGVYKGIPKLDIERLKEIRSVVDIPLVLHGASGLTDENVRECIRNGICKVNFATELRIAYSDGIKRVLAENPDVYDPKSYGKTGREYVKNLVKNRMAVLYK